MRSGENDWYTIDVDLGAYNPVRVRLAACNGVVSRGDATGGPGRAVYTFYSDPEGIRSLAYHLLSAADEAEDKAKPKDRIAELEARIARLEAS